MTIQTTTKPSSKNKIADKRQAIVDAAMELFTTVGYETTTISDVSKKAGVAVGTVYLYFKNKQELLYGVKDDFEITFVGYMQNPELQAVPHHLRARPLMEACFALCAQQTAMAQLMALPPQMIGDMFQKQDIGLIHKALQAFLEEGIAAGSFRPIDTKIAAIAAYGMVHDSLHQCFGMEGGVEVQRYIDALTDAFEHWFRRPELLKS